MNFVTEELFQFQANKHIDFSVYRKERIDALKGEALDWFCNWRPRIGVYAGSFNPFHKGHLNILHKAEQIFDKVIIAQGVNPEKQNKQLIDLKSIKCLQNRQVEQFDDFLLRYLFDKSEYAEVTLVKGLRSPADMVYEVAQLRALQDFHPAIKFAWFVCDKEYEHYSSSLVRPLLGTSFAQRYLPE